ncbi:MAG: hypothetical protein CVU64_20430 [Deltaproteobacteria bacterium HGW-Deltaproteobacteria-21]|nr:MAG: hypothetical protein CVU64_20430 [Deltaproteobacteria bacterium HGW-Deltaproteobacteria-21]
MEGRQWLDPFGCVSRLPQIDIVIFSRSRGVKNGPLPKTVRLAFQGDGRSKTLDKENPLPYFSM